MPGTGSRSKTKAPVVKPLVAGLVMAGLALSAASAHGQEVGMRVGVSGDPDQFYFGIHTETGELAERLRFRPNIEVGVGSGVTLVALNFEFAYRIPPRRTVWNLYVGAGPALNIARRNQDTSPEGGFNILIGVANPKGLFAELKVGALDSPSVKVGVGYVFR